MQIPVPDDGEATMRDVYYLQDHFAIMITLSKRKSKLDAVLAYLMDKNGTIGSNYKMVLETKEASYGYDNHYYFTISPDSTRFITCARNIKFGYYAVAAFSGNLEKLWEREISEKADLKTGYTSFIHECMDMDGNLLLMVKGTAKAFGASQLDNMLVVINGKENKVQTYIVHPPDKLQAYETGQFISDKSGHTWFCGMYGEKDTDAKGIAIASYKDGKFQTYFKTFSDRFRSAFMSDNKAAKGGTVDFLTIDYVLQNKDNSFELALHKYAPRAFVAAAAIKFDNNMNEVWSAPLPIYFWMVDEYFSYAPLVTDKEVCFIYNDNKHNKDIIDPRECSGLKDLDNAICVITRVNLKDGSVKKDLLPSSEDTYLMPVKCYQSNTNELLLFAKRKGQVNFGKLVLE